MQLDALLGGDRGDAPDDGAHAGGERGEGERVPAVEQGRAVGLDQLGRGGDVPAPCPWVKGVMSAGSPPWKGSGICHLSDSGVYTFGGHEPRPGGGLDVPQLGEVVARQVQVLVGAERALKRGLETTPARARVHVPELPASHPGAGDHARASRGRARGDR